MTRSWIEVSRSAIAHNYDAVKSLVGPDVEVAPVVKAEAARVTLKPGPTGLAGR